MRETTFGWVLDSGGAGRGAWQGGIIYEFMRWTRKLGGYPAISMGASAGGYAAADVATGTESTVMKGWTRWGLGQLPPASQVPAELRSFWGLGKFRLHLRDSIRYVMGESEVEWVFDAKENRKLLIFTTRVSRRDRKPFREGDCQKYLLKSMTRKLPRGWKFLPADFFEEPVVFATHLPEELQSEWVRPLTPENYHSVIEASCLVPVAMGWPLLPEKVNAQKLSGELRTYDGDCQAVFIDGGFTMKMPMGLFDTDIRFLPLARWTAVDKIMVFCCDPTGNLWETSSRLNRLNDSASVIAALREGRLFIISPDHKVEAGFLCYDNAVTMRTFCRGQEQAERLLRSDKMRSFMNQMKSSSS
jgi:hypothetical protein